MTKLVSRPPIFRNRNQYKEHFSADDEDSFLP